MLSIWEKNPVAILCYNYCSVLHTEFHHNYLYIYTAGTLWLWGTQQLTDFRSIMTKLLGTITILLDKILRGEIMTVMVSTQWYKTKLE